MQEPLWCRNVEDWRWSIDSIFIGCVWAAIHLRLRCSLLYEMINYLFVDVVWIHNWQIHQISQNEQIDRMYFPCLKITRAPGLACVRISVVCWHWPCICGFNVTGRLIPHQVIQHVQLQITAINHGWKSTWELGIKQKERTGWHHSIFYHRHW